MLTIDNSTLQGGNMYLSRWVENNRESYQAHSELTHRKLDAVFMLLHYGAENWETLNKVAKAAKVSAGTLRVWRTEHLFQALHRKIVWACTNAFVGELMTDFMSCKESQGDSRMLVSHKISSFEEMGSATQHAVLWRIVFDALQICTTWPPFIDRCDMVDDLLLIADSRPEPMKSIEKASVTPELLQFAWSALDKMHGSRAANVQQRQRHFAVKTFLGLKMAQAAYGASRSPQSATEAVLPFLADPNDLEQLEGAFTALYSSKRLDRRVRVRVKTQ